MYMLRARIMRPSIPKSLERELERDVSDLEDMKLFEVGGYNSKGEFIRAAVREKIEEHKEKHL